MTRLRRCAFIHLNGLLNISCLFYFQNTRKVHWYAYERLTKYKKSQLAKPIGSNISSACLYEYAMSVRDETVDWHYRQFVLSVTTVLNSRIRWEKMRSIM
jgi:hypothetical protein